MKIFDAAKAAAAPYMFWIKIGVVLALIATVAGWVRYYGHTKFEAGEAKAQGVVDAKNRALKANARAFNAFADKFREIDANTAREIEAAEAQQRAGLVEAERAERARSEMLVALDKLGKILDAERAECPDGRKPICGTKLR